MIESCVNFAIAQSVDAVLYGYADKVLGKRKMNMSLSYMEVSGTIRLQKR